MVKTLTTDVLVVGAGPAGLTAAALLARSGVPSLTVTKYGSTADSPRAHITNQRAVEIFRDLGIEERVMQRALPQHLMGKQVFATAFAGRELSRMMTWGAGDDRRTDYQAASPCEMCNAPQHVLEPILLDAARVFGADIRFNHEVVAIDQTPEYVLARVRSRRERAEARDPCPLRHRLRRRPQHRRRRRPVRVRRPSRSGQRPHGVDRGRPHSLHEAPLRSAVLRLRPRQ